MRNDGDSEDRDTDGGRRGLVRRLLPVGVLACGLVAFFAFDLGRFVSFQALADNRDLLQEWVAAYPLATRAGYALTYALSIAFSLPVGLVLTVTGGLLFGLVEGTAITVVAATAGALAVFLAARTAIGDSLRAKAGPFVARLEAGFRENALSYLLVLRLVPLFPFWLVNIVPALLGVSTRIFLVGTLFGIIPGTFVFVSVGNGLDTVFSQGEVPGVGIFLEPGVLLPIAGLALLSLIPVVYRRFRRGTPSSA
ncbi:MAG: TVP38/TMEM64 family protein [Alphaproteobacteria bacterium]|nr:TVP38/TMEM64 family protein [Alphaproteobacteria bacterium]